MIDIDQTWDQSLKVNEFIRYISKDFKNESEMCDYIEKNAELFAKDVLEIEYKSHKREYYLGDTLLIGRKKGNLPRIDFAFTSIDNEIILVECKNPSNIYSELCISIGQILSYYCIAKKNGVKVNRICIVSTQFNMVIRDIIIEFNLPIEFYILNKTNLLKLINGSSN